MNIIIVGCGQVGETLATELGAEGNNITVIDLSYQKVNAIASKLDVRGVVGNGATHTTLSEAGIESTDLLIAVTASDELNLLCCMIAKKYEGCKVIAKVQNPVYNSEAQYLKNELGLAMVINPDYAAALEIARVLRFPVANRIDTFSGGRVELLKFRIPEGSVLIGNSVKNIAKKLNCDVLLCTAERDDAAYIVNGDFVFRENDLVSVVATPKNANEFFKKIGYKSSSVKDVFIVGASTTTHYLCDLLKKSGMSLKVLEKDSEKCEELASSHDEITVICGDETDQDLLVEEGIKNTDAFLALTGFDEENIFLSISAKNYGNSKTVLKIDRPEYDNIIRHLDIDTTIYPKSIAADLIVRYVRSMKNTMGSNVETMYSFIKDKVEAVEFIIGENSEIAGIPLAALAPKLKADVLVAAILRDGKVIIPHGQDSIQKGDSVVIISKLLGITDISDIIG